MKKIKILFFILFFLVFLYSIFTGAFLKPINDLHRGQKIVLFFKKKYNANILYNLKFYIIEMEVTGEIDDRDLISLGFGKVNSFYCSDYGRILIEKYYDYKIVKYTNNPCKSEIEEAINAGIDPSKIARLSDEQRRYINEQILSNPNSHLFLGDKVWIPNADGGFTPVDPSLVTTTYGGKPIIDPRILITHTGGIQYPADYELPTHTGGE